LPLKTLRKRVGWCVLLAAAAVSTSAPGIAADAPATPDARTQAPIDLTGYWVSLVTEDWRYRMLVADPGDTESIPLNDEGVKAAKAWNPQADRKDAESACRAFGAAGLMRIPGRINIRWDDGNTLRIETDSGSQTRLLHFGVPKAADATPSWQGYSVASWQGTTPVRRGPKTTKKEGFLQVDTSELRSGYLRTNGVPYSAQAQLVEYFDGFTELNGDQYLVVTTVVTDPKYLTVPFVTSSHFKKIPDRSGWDPTPCRAAEPR
jgi:hypothetical protein